MSERVSLSNLGEGAAIELFDLELQRVLDNIIDENTSPGVVREVNLKIKIKPDQDREWGSVQIAATSKLAAVTPYPTQIIIGKDRGQGVATEHNPKQLSMRQQLAARKASENVVSIKGESND